MNNRIAAGFTLLEIIIALAIFAILSLLVAQGLKTVTNTQQKLNTASEQWQQLTLAVALIRRDLGQIVSKPYRDTTSQNFAPVQSGTDDSFSFSRTGWQNPNATAQRSDLIRVRLALKNQTLTRTTWPLDPNSDPAQPTTQTLLQGVTQFRITYVYDGGKISAIWPISTRSKEQVNALPDMIRLSITSKKFGVIKIDVRH